MEKFDVIVLGGGFAGLASAYALAKNQVRVALIEKDESVGGLASAYHPQKGQAFEKFYHHWFCNDNHILSLACELQLENELDYCTSRTGSFYMGKFYKLSSPWDLLKFKPLSLIDRIRLGLLIPQSRLVRNWKVLESITARQWLMKKCGRKVFETVWEPLLRGKFGSYADEISAVWFWNKIVLRGTSRDKTGKEVLIYPKKSFQAFSNRIADKIRDLGGVILTDTTVENLVCKNGKVTALSTNRNTFGASYFLSTFPLPITTDLLEPHCDPSYIDQLRSIKHLANVCLILELSQKLSDLYWINICDPNFPFVGIIEHTNLQSNLLYNGRHLVYLSRYVDENNSFFKLNKDEILEISVSHLNRIFPGFKEQQILDSHLFKTRYAQPIVGLNYSRKIPSWESPLPNFFFETMAQVYPEDRGTNYAVRQGLQAGKKIADIVKNKTSEGTLNANP